MIGSLVASIGVETSRLLASKHRLNPLAMSSTKHIHVKFMSRLEGKTKKFKLKHDDMNNYGFIVYYIKTP